MKAIVVLFLAAGVLGAPTHTFQERDFDLSSLASPSAALGGSPSSVASWPSATGLSAPDSLESSAPISSPEGALRNLASAFAKGSMNANDVKDNTGCKEYTFIFARGTTEFGNMGAVVGPPVASKLSDLTGGKVAVQGVDYPASIEGNIAMGAAGGPDMVSLVEKAISQCPDTKILLGGYSQGAMVVHNAASKLPAGKVVGAVTFGDPFKIQDPPNVGKFKTWCAMGDPVCLNGFNVMAHLSYGGDAAEAAQFLLGSAGAAGAAGAA